MIVQDIEIKPRNMRFPRSVFYWPKQNKHFRGALPGGYDARDFGADSWSLILSLKYCGNMSEPTIREVLDNFGAQISTGSVSNMLTKTASKKDELLTVLCAAKDSSHNNASQLQARVSVRRRDASLHGRSARGARARNIFTTIVPTAKPHGLSAKACFRDRIGRRFEFPSLAQSIQDAAASG